MTEVLMIDAVRPGRRLAAALRDEQGQLLMPAGVELSEGTLHSLRRRGVRELCVERECAADPAEREARLRQQRENLDQRFRCAGESPETAALYAALLAFLVDQA